MDPAPKFNLGFQLDMSIIPDHTGLLGSNGQSSASFTTDASQGTALGEAPPQEIQAAPLNLIVQGEQCSITNSSLTNSTDKPMSPVGPTQPASLNVITPSGSAVTTNPSNRQENQQNG